MQSAPPPGIQGAPRPCAHPPRTMPSSSSASLGVNSSVQPICRSWSCSCRHCSSAAPRFPRALMAPASTGCCHMLRSRATACTWCRSCDGTRAWAWLLVCARSGWCGQACKDSAACAAGAPYTEGGEQCAPQAHRIHVANVRAHAPWKRCGKLGRVVRASGARGRTSLPAQGGQPLCVCTA